MFLPIAQGGGVLLRWELIERKKKERERERRKHTPIKRWYMNDFTKMRI